MRRLFGIFLVAVMLLSGSLVSGCGLTGGPGGSPAGAVQPDNRSIDGLPSPVAAAVRKQLEADTNLAFAHWLRTEKGYYLVDLVMKPTNEHTYWWVPSDGSQATFFAGFAENAAFAGETDGLYRFICDRVGDAFPVFPYYEVGQAGGKPQEAPFFKVPNGGAYNTSTSGLAFELSKVTQDSMSLELLFRITGAEPGGVMAGGSRPPAGKIIESDESVKVQLGYVTLGPGAQEALESFTSRDGSLKGFSCSDGKLELEFSVPWAYSVSLASEKTQEQAGGQGGSLLGYRISFVPKPEPTGVRPSLSGIAATIKGMRVGASTVDTPGMLGNLQGLLLRAFPLLKEPSNASHAVDFSLLTAGQWMTERKAYVAGAQGQPSYLKWQGEWYELSPEFGALLKSATR